MGKPTHTSVWLFTEDQKERLLPIWNDDIKAFSIFQSEIASAMTKACRKKITLGEKRKLQNNARLSADKFMADFKSCDLFMEMWHCEEGKREIETLWSIKRKLEYFSNELIKRDKRTSKHKELATAIGPAMNKSGLKVSSYDLGNAVGVIEICFESAGLPPTENQKDLARTAMQAAKLSSN